MKVVDYETFIRMPAGTVFAPVKDGNFDDEFEIKVDGGEEYEYKGKKKYVYCGTMPLSPWLMGYNLPLECYKDYEVEMEIYDGDSNDASEYSCFAVLEPHEVKSIINALYWALDGCPGALPDNYKEVEKTAEHVD